MSTPNFCTQRDFPLYCIDDSEMDWPEAQEFYGDLKCELDGVNDGLCFFNISVKSGYYCGAQFYVDLSAAADNAGFDENGATRWADNASTRDYLDMYLSEAKRKFETERRKVNRLLEKLANAWGFEQYVCTAIFSNGEAIYEKASNKRALLKAAAIA